MNEGIPLRGLRSLAMTAPCDGQVITVVCLRPVIMMLSAVP